MRDPVRPRADAAVAVRGTVGEGGAVGAGRRRAARRLRAPPGRRRAGPGRAPGTGGAPAARRGRACSRATSARAAPLACWATCRRPSGWCGWWRSPTTPRARGSWGASAPRRRPSAWRWPRTCSATWATAAWSRQALYLDTRMFLPDGLLICADKMSMSASLEQRVPFLDLELMRFVERIPVRERVRVRQGKRAHRAAMARLVPRRIVDRPKHGFSTPYDSWLRESLGEEVVAALRARVGARGAGRPGHRVGPGGRAPLRAAPTTSRSSTACSSCRSGTGPTWRSRARRWRPRPPGR